MSWEKLPGIDGGHGGCGLCGFQHAVLPMTAVIAVGFGSASLTKDDRCIWDDQEANGDFDSCMTAEQAEEMARTAPDHDWRIHFFGPLSEKHYQRQGERHWVLYEKGQGFA